MKQLLFRAAVVVAVAALAILAIPARSAAEGDPALERARAVAQSIAGFLYAGERDAAERYAAENEAVAFDALPAGAFAEARVREDGEGTYLEARVIRSDSARPLVVYFPPGTYGEPVDRTPTRVERLEPAEPPQDLALLRAPVVVLRAGERFTSTKVPIACALFHGSPPNERYRLRRFERGSEIDRVMVALCAGEPEDERAAQLAVWIARNDITRSELAASRGAITFYRRRRLAVEQGRDAADILIRAGLDLETRRFYDLVAPRPAAKPEPEPAPAPTPAPTPPAPPRDDPSRLS